MPLFNSNKKKMQRELEEKDRQRQEQERRHREQLHLQQQENDRKAREYETKMRALEQEKYQREMADRAREEEAQRERERKEYEKQQTKMKARERENRHREKLRQTTPDALRNLRDLIRERYRLDVKIWGLRNVKQSDQREVILLGQQADAVLAEIHAMVDTWDRKSFDTDEEWMVAKTIKHYLNIDCHRTWEGNPPWNDEY